MKVPKKKVRYLVFEGGGGKGLIYLGAGKALAELGIINHVKKQVNEKEVLRLNSKKIKGVAGTSVGSLAAVLIACGYTYDEENGDSDNDVAPGTAFEDLPDDWTCPMCGLGKNMFIKK